MSDLDKLMNKLKKPEKQEDIPEETEEEETDDEEEDFEEDDDEEVEEEKPKPAKKKSPQETEELSQDAVEQEVAILQNPAIYRRERLMIEKERNVLLNAIAHILSDALGGNNDNKKAK